MRFCTYIRLLGCLLLLLVGLPHAEAPAADIDFGREVAPLLKTYCAGCHNDSDREGNLSLSSLSALRAGTPDGAIINAEKPAESKLIKVLAESAESRMPPEDEPQPTAEQIAIIRAWVEQGAKGDSAISAMTSLTIPKLSSDPAASRHVTAACNGGDGRTVVGKFAKVEMRDAGGSIVWEFTDLPGKINQLRLTPDGKSVVVASGMAGVGGEVALLDANDGRLQQRLPGHTDAVYCAAASADGRWLASGSYDRTVILWDRATGQAVRTLSGHNGAIYDLDFDSLSFLIATASADQTVKIWNLAGLRLDTLGQPQGEVLSVRFSHDGKYLFAAGVDRQIRKWELISRTEPAINPLLVARFAHEDDVLQIELLDKDHLISTSTDHTIKLFDTAELRPLGELGKTQDVPSGIAMSSGSAIQIFDIAGNSQTIDRHPIDKLIAAGKISSAKSAATVPPIPFNTAENQPPSVVGESEPNNEFAQAAKLDLPAQITGVIDVGAGGVGDVDVFRFSATAGEPWIIEVNAARSGSPLDSRIEIIDEFGNAVLRTLLQATRESYFTFRGKDSATSDDFRMHNWEDMELNEYLYASGEVVKLWLYPRGPDSGFKVYPGVGSRYTYFGTTPTSHALGEPAYIVRELVAEEEPLPNGLPVFPIYFENDDDGLRRWGSDSRLEFVAPRTGDYFLKIRDARGFGGKDFKYTLNVQHPRPNFEIKVTGNKMSMPVGSGREWQVTATRLDGLDEPISVELQGLPAGYLATNPLVIEAGQQTAAGTIFATTEAAPGKSELTLVARSSFQGKAIEHVLVEKLELELSTTPELQFKLVDVSDGVREIDELTIRPGKSISARIIVNRADVTGPVSFGGDDSGRNLPHGTIVGDIGLNGLLIPEGMTEREFVIVASKWLPPQRRQIHLRSQSKGNPTSRPIWLNVVPE